jgi:hypothetical protein
MGGGEMTDQQINVAIATHLGITRGVPDFSGDLNEMHEAEKTLSEDQMWIMARKIELNENRWYFHASARERAEAFLRTLGKWEEVQK